jgi:hypothetical protein
MDKNRSLYEILYSKAKYLTLEAEFIFKEFSGYKQDFLEAIGTIDIPPDTIGMSIEAIQSNIDNILLDEEISEESTSVSKPFKKLYRSIMTIVHPDKVACIDSEVISESYKRLSGMANNACSDENWFVLFDICDELNIDNIEISDENIAWLKRYCESKKSESDGLKKTYPWIWSQSDEKVKHFLEQEFVKKKIKKV